MKSRLFPLLIIVSSFDNSSGFVTINTTTPESIKFKTKNVEFSEVFIQKLNSDERAGVQKREQKHIRRTGQKDKYLQEQNVRKVQKENLGGTKNVLESQKSLSKEAIVNTPSPSQAPLVSTSILAPFMTKNPSGSPTIAVHSRSPSASTYILSNPPTTNNHSSLLPVKVNLSSQLKSDPIITSNSSIVPSISPTIEESWKPSYVLSIRKASSIPTNIPNSEIPLNGSTTTYSEKETNIPNSEIPLNGSTTTYSEKETYSIQIPVVEMRMLINSTSIDKNIVLDVTAHHMTKVFESGTTKDFFFEYLSLSYMPDGRRLRIHSPQQQQPQQRELTIQETIFYLEGNAIFSSNTGEILDESMVTELTLSSFVGDNLIAYSQLLRFSDVDVTNVYANISDTYQKNGAHFNKEDVTTIIPTQSDSKHSSNLRMIISLSLCGTIIVFFLSSLIIFHGKKSCLVIEKQKVTDEVIPSSPERPVSFIEYEKNKDDVNKSTWKTRLYGFGLGNQMEIDEVSAISIDSSLCSTVTSSAWGTTSVVLANEDITSTIEEDETEEERLDRELQPGKVLYTGQFGDIAELKSTRDEPASFWSFL